MSRILGLLIIAWFSLAGSASAEPTKLISQMVDVGPVDMQVYTVGETGPTLVYLQDMHDYLGNPLLVEGGAAPSFGPFLTTLGEDFRVLAPIRRGYGTTGDLGWGYDVVTHAEDVLRMLDKLGIEQALFMGRSPAQNEMLWLAWHHPERVLGLVMLETPPFARSPHFARGASQLRDPDYMAYEKHGWGYVTDISPDPERARQIVGERIIHWSHLNDPDPPVTDLPLLLFEPAPEDRGPSTQLARFDRNAPNHGCDSERQSDYCAMMLNPQRAAKIRAALVAASSPEELANYKAKLRHSFPNITLIQERPRLEIGDQDRDYFEWRMSKMRPFLKRFLHKAD